MDHSIGVAFAALDAVGLYRDVWGRDTAFHANDAIQIDDTHLELRVVSAESDLSRTDGFMTAHDHTSELVELWYVHVASIAMPRSIHGITDFDSHC